MVLMTLREWDKLTIIQRKAWLKEQSPASLRELLSMILEIIEQTDRMNQELDMLEPCDSITNARIFTNTTLRNIQTALIETI